MPFFFDHYPYTNFHNVNLDWVLQAVKAWGEMVEQNNQNFINLDETMTQFKLSLQADWLNYQDTINQEYADWARDIRTQWVTFWNEVRNYLHDLDVSQEINDKLDEMASNGELLNIISPTISENVSSWLAEHITPTTPTIDNTLTIAGAGADAKVTGDKTRALTYATRSVSKVEELSLEPIMTAGQFIRYDTGNATVSTGRTYSNYIDVSFYDKITYARISETQTTGVIGIAFYDSSKQFIPNSGIRMLVGQSFKGYVSSTVTVPSGAYYVRCSGFEDATEYGDFYIYGIPRINEYINSFNDEFTNIDKILSENTVKTYCDFKEGYIDTSGNTVTLTPISNSDFKHIIVKCSEGDCFNLDVLGGNASRVRCVFIDENNNILYKSSTSAEYDETAPPFRYNAHYAYKAPANTAYIVVNHRITVAGFTPKIYKCFEESLNNYKASLNGELPYMPIEEWKRNVIATYNNYIAIKDGSNIRISSDCGTTWSENINASSIDSIKNAHIYSDGTLTFFTDLKAYYVNNNTIYESTVYESDGTTLFIADSDSNFNAGRDHAERKFINGNDMYVFNNYHETGNGRPLIFYSIDKGRTYKVALEFNINDMPNVRHIHDVIYWEDFDKFILCTGDTNATQCFVCEMTYDVANDTWSFNVLAGSSRTYKWAGLALWNNEIYYTHDSTPGSVWKCKYYNIADSSTHDRILDFTEDDCNNVVIGKNGDIIVTQSTARSTAGINVPTPFTAQEACRKIYYSSNQKDFNAIFLPNQLTNKSLLLNRPKPVTSDGHVYFSTYAGVDGLPSVPIDNYCRLYINKQAFKEHI